jgi:hypothetical protein
MKIEISEVVKNVFHAKFESQYELTSTFLRFQEYYESPMFQGKIFTLEEYKKWYIKNSPNGLITGDFTYYTDWAGFNLPSYILQPFYNGEFAPLSDKETMLLNLFEKINQDNEHYYIIGTFHDLKEDNATFRHEVAHGLFYTNPDYKNEVLKILDDMDSQTYNDIRDILLFTGYDDSVMIDEVHAFTFTAQKFLLKKGVDINRVKDIANKLQANFEIFYEAGEEQKIENENN